MKRYSITPRYDYQNLVERQGFGFHSQYWTENAYYSFTKNEVTQIESDVKMMYDLYVQATEHFLDTPNFLNLLGIPREFHQTVRESWEMQGDMSVYGRFDIAQDPVTKRWKIIEFNADTPTSLYEASMIQWLWKEDVFKDNDQFNGIHEALVARWQEIPYGEITFCAINSNLEDLTTISYLAETAREAGKITSVQDIEQLGYNERLDSFTDVSGDVNHDRLFFKLYPWEWMIDEAFGCHLHTNHDTFIEPLWKLMWTSKGMLPFIYQYALEVDQSYLPIVLPAYFEKGKLKDFARKPIFSREGANVSIVNNNSTVESTSGDYGDNPTIDQEYIHIRRSDGYVPMVGAWVVDNEPVGIGIRETNTLVTDNMSRFVPHIIE